MQLILNIEDFSRPVVSETKRADYLLTNSSLLSKFFSFFINRIKKRLNRDLDKLILFLEEFNPCINELPNNVSTDALAKFEKAIKELIKCKEKMDEINYFDDNNIKEKYLYSLKLLFQTESKLHRAVYRSKPIEKTSDELIDGVMKMNSNYINDLLS